MDLKLPPLVVLLLSVLAQIEVSSYVPIFSLHFIPEWLPWLWIGFGLFICLLGVLEFRKHKTTLNPIKPQTSQTIVNTGIYHYSRNPMYLGMALSLIGSGLWVGDVSSIIGVIFFIVYINEFQVKPEEKALKMKFEDQFQAYRSEVRRWL